MISALICVSPSCHFNLGRVWPKNTALTTPLQTKKARPTYPWYGAQLPQKVAQSTFICFFCFAEDGNFPGFDIHIFDHLLHYMSTNENGLFSLTIMFYSLPVEEL